jgi:hypothetical protein
LVLIKQKRKQREGKIWRKGGKDGKKRGRFGLKPVQLIDSYF